jgi:protein involved in polysaccharide export with SLBB domain
MTTRRSHRKASGVRAPIRGVAFWTIVALAGNVTAAAGETYSLTPGALVRIEVSSDPSASAERRVDPDGRLFVSGLGRIPVSGRSLDEAEELIDAENGRAGIYFEGSLSIALVSAAPVRVGGAVRFPGQVEYVVGMTAGEAAALAGGASDPGLTPAGAMRMRSEIEGDILFERTRLRSLELEIAQLAAMEDGDLEEFERRAQRVLGSGLLERDALARAERVVRAALGERDDVVTALDAALVQEEQRIRVFEQRVELARSLVDLRRAEAAQVLDTIERGLRPASEALRFEVSVAVAEEGLLLAQTALADGNVRAAELREEKIRFLAARERSLAEDVVSAGAEFSASRARLIGLERRLDTLGADPNLLHYAVIRDGRIVGRGQDATVRSGDMVEVSLEASEGTGKPLIGGDG